MTVLQADALTKNYDGVQAVRGVSFRIQAGELFGFLGPNGAGKTTTINMLTGLCRITSGTARLLDYDLGTQIKAAQRHMGIVPDDSNLYDELTGRDNLVFAAALYGMTSRQSRPRADELLERFGLNDAANRKFKTYSRGMKRRLTIAAGLIHQPAVLFLDEPTSGTDVASSRQIRRLLLDLRASGTTIFMTTHNIEEAERLCSRVAFIVNGEIVREGITSELVAEAEREHVVEFDLGPTKPPLDLVQQRFSGVSAEVRPTGRLRIGSPEPLDLLPLLTMFGEANYPVYEAKVIRPSLEEVFVKVTGIEADRMQAGKEGGRRK